MNAYVIDLKRDEDIMVPAPWPIGIDANGVVTSGLGNDDGAVLIGFAQSNVQGLEHTADEIDSIDWEAQDLVPVFSKNGGFFNWQVPVRGIRKIEGAEPEVITDKHFVLDIQMSNDDVLTGEGIAALLMEIAEDVAGGRDGRAIYDHNGNKVGAWGYKEVAR